MVWSIHGGRRHRPLNANRPQLVTLTEGDAKMLRYGVGYFGGLKAFSFECPGRCETVHEIRPGQRRRHFNPRTQRFRCPECGIELQLSILAEILPPRLTKRGAAEYEDALLQDFAAAPPDTVRSLEHAATMRRGGESGE